MSTLVELQQHRAHAGAAYVAAFTALKAAYVNLAAIDIAMGNAKILGLKPASFPADFDGLCNTLRFLHHQQYSPALVANWLDEANEAARQIIAAFPTPD